MLTSNAAAVPLSDVLEGSLLSLAGNCDVKLELDHRERRAVGKSLAQRKALLTEVVQDTTRHVSARRAGSVEIEAIKSVLRKLLSDERSEP